MSQIKLQPWSLCPWRSPVAIPTPSVLTGPAAAPREAPEALGPCLYLACGLFHPTKVVNGQVVDGMCAIRFAAMQIGAKASLLERGLALLERVVKRLVPGEDQQSS